MQILFELLYVVLYVYLCKQKRSSEILKSVKVRFILLLPRNKKASHWTGELPFRFF